MLSAAMLLSCATAYVSASAEVISSPIYEKKNVKAYDDVNSSNIVEYTCLFRSDLPEIPFVNVEDYLGQLFNIVQKPANQGNGVYVFENGDYSMTLNADNDIVSFDFYEGFIANDPKHDSGYGECTYLENGGIPVCVDDNTSFEADLSKYDLDIVEQDGNVYLPFCTLNDFFADTNYNMTYRKDQLKMVISSMGAKGSFTETRSKQYAKLVYDEFCLAADVFQGKPSNALITASIEKIGLDKTLDTYNSITPRIKELLLSESTEDFCTGWILLQHYLDDGGHTILDYSMKERLKKYGIPDAASAARKVFGNTDNKDAAELIESETAKADTQKKSSLFISKQSEAYSSFEIIKDWGGAALYRSGDTYIFCFRGFAENILEPCKWSMDYANEHNAKTFIFDTNAGGDPNAAIYMISLMKDTNTIMYSEKRIATGNIMKFVGRVDKNLDGKFDENDSAVKYDFRCALLTNHGYYSCGNIFACMAKDNGICVIGEKTSGGSCAATSRTLPNGTSYNVSGYFMYLPENGADPDYGAEPDVAIADEENDYNNFYNISALEKGIAKFYGDPITEQNGLYGDLNNDREVNSADALFVLRMSVGLEKQTVENKTPADVDGNGVIDSADALSILRFSAGISEPNSRISTPISQ